MATKRILLWSIPDEILLIVEHPSGVIYQNQVGGNVCWQAEVEGVLSPLAMHPEPKKRIQGCPYPNGRQGISTEIADTLDGIFTASNRTSFLKVDRTRLHECWEAWVYVLIDTPEKDDVEAELFGPYFGPAYGFGQTKGVLTWLNSD